MNLRSLAWQWRMWQRQASRAEILLLVLLTCGVAALGTSLLAYHDSLPGPASVSGQVTFDGHPVAGAQVSLNERAGSRVHADSAGNFRFRDLPSGCFTLTITTGPLRAGYPIKVPAGGHCELGAVPLYRWRADPQTGRHGYEPGSDIELTIHGQPLE
ncbi:MAG: carboxypeptidase regulatory-like domain-containing protein [Armatimonadetes bacterium]|nr:carboxypeptidase regulatory-like domain-containing protein [Armatimonadota bacterium]